MPPPQPTAPAIQALELRRAELLAQISSIGPLRPGTVSEIQTKCGRPNCHCKQPGDPGHGPYFRLVFNTDGKQTTRSLPARHAAAVRSEVAECQRLRQLTDELIEVSAALSDARLQSAAPVPGPRKNS